MKAMSLRNCDISFLRVALVVVVSIGSIDSIQTFNAYASASHPAESSGFALTPFMWSMWDYNTTYRWRGPQDGNLRFTSSPNRAFSITDLMRPGSQIVTSKPIPIQPGAKSTMFGYHGALQWTQQNGTLIIPVPTAAQQAGKNAWAFKIGWS